MEWFRACLTQYAVRWRAVVNLQVTYKGMESLDYFSDYQLFKKDDTV